MSTRPRAISLAAVALSLVASLGLAACRTTPDRRSDLAQVTGAPSDPVTVTGSDATVTGRYLMEGGPIHPDTGKTADPWPIDGQVTFSSGRRTVNAIAGHDGEFFIRLAAGTYTVTARTPQLTGPGSLESGCSLPQTITVHTGVAATITVYCPVP
jgi:hypothetical protein